MSPSGRYAEWARLAVEALSGYDALYVHIKGPDVPAHDGRAEDKRDVIAAIDAGFFSEVLRSVDLTATIVAVTADHSTSCVRKAHTADPVPAPGERRRGPVRRLRRRSGSVRAPMGALGLLRGVSRSCPASRP